LQVVWESLKMQKASQWSATRTDRKQAMSMLNFYINRGGRSLPAAQKSILEGAKIELRKECRRG
jgi:hypothetical protein